MLKTFIAVFVLILTAACAAESPQSSSVADNTPAAASIEDPHLWLEEVEGARALAWVEEQNRHSVSYLQGLPTFDDMASETLEIMNSDQRIAMPSIRGDFVYNFWKDANNVRGLWRRTSVDDYLAGTPDWQVLLDLDALAEEEGEDWVWKGSNCLRPEYRHCVLRLSRGGADAVVIREFDVAATSFVEGGFYVSEAKTQLSWIDADTVFVGTDFGDGSLTESGYPRTSRVWKRGTALEGSIEVFSGEVADVAASASMSWDGDNAYRIATRTPSFFTAMHFLMAEDGEMKRIEIPDDALFQGVFNGQMLVGLKSDWTPAETTFAQGSLLAVDFDDFMNGGRDFEALFVPAENTALPRGGIMSTRDYIVLNILEDVVSRMVRLERVDGEWIREDIETESPGSISFVTSSEDTNTFLFSYEGFLRPDTLYVTEDGGASIEELQTLPAFFDSEGMAVEQRFATSSDGTRVPYFLMLPAGFEADGTTPTLLYGYGGFRVSLTPGYSATVGTNWVSRGGAYVVANIRGGGEYGPAWHQAALKENRQRAYDDFIAVAEDLISRGVTSPKHLGIRGGSNGGLLTGVMLTQRPDLWNAVVVQVPLLDMKRFNQLLAGASWMGEYGNPDTDDWEFIRQYSPYHNVEADVQYPRAYITTSTRDDRVHPGHARKMVARMQGQGHDLLYFENTVGGHAGASDNTQSAKNEAMVYSYLWDQLGWK